ncbi:protein angel homolog 2 isoform X2 [Cydia strobilella]|uniref:protein angel homolog 2 isoform X2 n=1 Tax=Cydia strobilella TaxID=1100964 RepID=UPI003006EDD0
MLFAVYILLSRGRRVNKNVRTHIRKYSHLSCKRKSCCTVDRVQISIFGQIYIPSQQVQSYANAKPTLRLKRLTLKSNNLNKIKQMSEPWQPTPNHVSYGGQFVEICSDDDSATEAWQENYSRESTSCASQSLNSSNIPPDFRVWESTGKTTKYNSGNPLRFRVLSYNVLAQYLLECHPYLYTQCTPRNLKWKIRAARLYDEILKLAPDILCLQEVQASHLNSFYSKFEKIGYSGIFKRKTGHRHDGCAIYFKHSLFEMQDTVSVEFYQPELPILNRDNIGMMVKLVPRHCPDTPIVVVTTHLLYNPKRTDVRLAQMQLLLAEIDRFAYFDNGRESGHIPVILTGDFNSTPDSAVVRLLDKGHVSASPFRDSSDWKKIGVTDNCQHLSVLLNRSKGLPTDFCMTKIYNSEYRSNLSELEDGSVSRDDEYGELFNSGALGHCFNLVSVYDKVKHDGSHEATTFQDYWVTVDYIYFSCCSSMKLVERLRLPTAAECQALGKLPNDVYASDHLALGGTFELKPLMSSL